VQPANECPGMKTPAGTAFNHQGKEKRYQNLRHQHYAKNTGNGNKSNGLQGRMPGKNQHTQPHNRSDGRKQNGGFERG